MMMQMLAAGGMSVLVDLVRSADEDNRRGYFEFEPVKRTRLDPSWLCEAAGKAVKMVYLLLYDLPLDYQYRVVLMQRPIGEVLASQHAMLIRRGQPGATLSSDQLADLFIQEGRKIEQWLAERPNFQTLKVDYDLVLSDAARQSTRINDFLGGNLDRSAMTRAVEPALRRQKA